MPDYDDKLFDPPAPVAKVTLRNPETGVTISEVPLLIDSGADATVIPQASVTLIGVVAIPDTRYELEGFDGSVSNAQVAQFDLLFLNRTFRGRFLLTDQDWGFLGRNILNHMSILHDGPNLAWDEQNPSSL